MNTPATTERTKGDSTMQTKEDEVLDPERAHAEAALAAREADDRESRVQALIDESRAAAAAEDKRHAEADKLAADEAAYEAVEERRRELREKGRNEVAPAVVAWLREVLVVADEMHTLGHRIDAYEGPRAVDAELQDLVNALKSIRTDVRLNLS